MILFLIYGVVAAFTSGFVSVKWEKVKLGKPEVEDFLMMGVLGMVWPLFWIMFVLSGIAKLVYPYED